MQVGWFCLMRLFQAPWPLYLPAEGVELQGAGTVRQKKAKLYRLGTREANPSPQ